MDGRQKAYPLMVEIPLLACSSLERHDLFASSLELKHLRYSGFYNTCRVFDRQRSIAEVGLDSLVFREFFLVSKLIVVR